MKITRLTINDVIVEYTFNDNEDIIQIRIAYFDRVLVIDRNNIRKYINFITEVNNLLESASTDEKAYAKLIELIDKNVPQTFRSDDTIQLVNYDPDFLEIVKEKHEEAIQRRKMHEANKRR